MKIQIFSKLACLLIAMLQITAFAAPPSTSPYYTDTVNSYVQDQVSQDMSQLNGFLCLLSAMAPHLMVNQSDYIALIDQNSCFNNGSGGKSSNTGANYLSAQVSSTRTSNNNPMQTKIWFNIPNIDVPMFASASQAPSKYLPYGIFRMDYCVKLPADTTCDRQRGFIDASRAGLAFYTSYNNTTSFQETALQLSSTSSTNSGSGVIVKTNYTTGGTPSTSATVFAYSTDYFYRDDGTGTALNPSGQCFSRSTRYASESAWRYGLYNINTGERLLHQSGFPIEYVDTSVTPNATYNGYISYWGLSMPVTVPSGSTVNQISYDTDPPTKTPYTLLKAGGKLTKYTTVTKHLTDLNKLPFWYYAYNTITVIGGSITQLTAGSTYEIYWDSTNQRFNVSGQYNTLTYNMEPLVTQGYMTNASMVAADPNGWGISAWSQLLGGNFTIKGSDFALLATTLSNTPVITQYQDVVYPQEFAAINSAGGLKCIGDCPDSTPTNRNPGWGPFTTLYSYSLNPTTGNLQDAAPVSGSPSGKAVISTTSYMQTGKMVKATDMATITSMKVGCPSCTYSQSDVDLLTNPTYYVWQTSSSSYDQMAFLVNPSSGAIISFYSPLPVNFNIPNNSATYGNLAGATITLQYGEYGNLWGIPNKCIDISNNMDCTFSGGTPTPSNKQRWTPQFSIPFDTTLGVVSTSVSQGAIPLGTQFLVKALDKEVRLTTVNRNICLVLGLTQPVTIPKLASYSDWQDPIPNLGTRPVLNPTPAPRVIHGVVKY